MTDNNLDSLKKRYPDKFVSESRVFGQIHPGNRIFIGTGCGEPQYLVGALINYVQSHPKSFVDAELLQVWTLGVTPYLDEKFKDNFRHNFFFIGANTRDTINKGIADYSPVFLWQVPELFRKKFIPIDMAFIQTSMPDEHGYFSLGISVDIVKSAVENAYMVVAQVNSYMPRVLGETFIHAKDINFIIPYNEPLLEFGFNVPNDIANRIGTYVSQIVQDGDTIQVGYGSLPNAILCQLSNKKNIGVHTELLSDGIVSLMKKGVIDNSKKELNRWKTVAAFCMGKKETYEFLHDNPAIEFRPVNYTNNPALIARQKNMTAINSALEIDLSGQATAETIGRSFYSGIGGQADFMRGAILSQGGKTILVLQSTAKNGGVSRIVPFLSEGAKITLTPGDIHYVVTEYGIAYLHGKNLRERAMDLISIAHPSFRGWLIEAAKANNLIYRDQTFIKGIKGEYPEALETYRTTNREFEILLRPVKISDEPLLKDFFYALSDDSMYRRFISTRTDMPHNRLQQFVAIDYTKEMIILAITGKEEKEMIIGMAQYLIDTTRHTAEVAFVVRDDYQNHGIGTELLSYITYIAKKNGLHGFTAALLMENKHMLHLLENAGFNIEKKSEGGMYELKMSFRD
ncbi:MAG: GNAT family N-acetyltransferase [Deltaproteobacteria bacterium]|nr:GNAT family N-acetyltransferase [Deltaproteobacteria bacterium]MCL5793121.1 GNAT family N-acetyltransferase [Deltaproteobacteria bacterium]